MTTSTSHLRIAVTGGSGKLGQETVARLRADGHQVLVLDQTGLAGPGFTRVDLRDYGQVVDALLGVTGRNYGLDALVHLAAIPAAGLVPDVEIVQHNLLVSFNLFWAARRAGILRIVYASSLQAMGTPFIGDHVPASLPLDENVTGAANPYGLVKVIEETIAAQMVAWDPGLSMTGLRFSYVVTPGEYEAMRNTPDHYRRDALGTYLDSRDAARAVARALETATAGHRIFNIAASDSGMDEPSTDLAARWFPGVPVDAALGEFDALVSTEKAARELDFRASFSWRRESTGRQEDPRRPAT